MFTVDKIKMDKLGNDLSFYISLMIMIFLPFSEISAHKVNHTPLFGYHNTSPFLMSMGSNQPFMISKGEKLPDFMLAQLSSLQDAVNIPSDFRGSISPVKR